MKAKDVLSLLDISRVTLCTYLKNGYIKGTKTRGGQYIYDDNSVYEFIGLKKQRHNTKIISYARVSTQAQKSQLQEQNQRIYESCISKGLQLDKQYSDIGSGMSENRSSFEEVCREIIRGNVEILVVENKDRLIRFGFDTLSKIFSYFGTQIVVLNDSINNKSYEQELTEDLISIIHYFSMKSYSHRRKLNKIRKELEKEDT